MDKLYYDCPLQAAYMSKEFGVLLLVEESYSNDSWLEDATPESLMKHIHLYGEENIGNIYIHPDSLPVFDCIEGDLIEGWAGRIGYVEEDEGDDELTIDVNGGTWECPKERNGKKLNYEIIQRNGKPFFTPKKGDV